MTRTAILSFARMPEDAMVDLRDGLQNLHIEVGAITSHQSDAALIRKVFPHALHYQWASYRTLQSWSEPFDSELYERVVGRHRSEALPLVERYGPFEGGSMEAETRLMHDFCRAHFLINTLKPDVLLFAKQPESGLEYLLYRIAKDQGITTIFSIRLGCLENLQAAGTELHQPLLNEKWEPAEHVIPLGGAGDDRGRLDPFTSNTIERIRNEGVKYLPDYTKNKVVNRPFPELLKALGKNARHPKRLWRDVFLQQDGPVFKYNLLKQYERVAVRHREIQWGQYNIFFPLHYQPEITTMPLGACYVNQIRAIKRLSDSTPSDTKILVKEHNSQFAYRTGGNKNYRPRDYYRWLKSIPKVELVDRTVPAGLLQQEVDITAVITGTAGFEAMVRGMHVLVFGTPFYMNGPGVHRFDENEFIQRVVTKGVNDDERMQSENASLEFLTRLESIALPMSEKVRRMDRVTGKQDMSKDSLLQACARMFG